MQYNTALLDYSHGYGHIGIIMLTVSKGVLKAKMLEYFRQVERTKEELVVTDHHRPVLKIIPYVPKTLPTDVFKNVTVTYSADINIPTSSEWDEV